MARLEWEKSDGGVALTVRDPLRNWEALSEGGDTVRFARAGAGTWTAFVAFAQDREREARFEAFLAENSVPRDRIKALRDALRNRPKLEVGATRSTKTVRLSPDDPVGGEILFASGARWFESENTWKIPKPLRDAASAAFDAYGRRSSAPPASFPYPTEAVLTRYPTLKPHQHDLARYVWELRGQGRHGLLVADRMGVGKTGGSLLAGLNLVDSGLAERVVCVVPASLIVKGDNWRGDVKKLFGIDARFPGLADSKRRASDPEPEDSPVAIYSYHSLAKPDVLAAALRDARGGVVIFDEAHAFCAHWETSHYKHCLLLSQTADFSIVLTGTPVQKDLKEFWTEMQLADPALLPRREFLSHYTETKTRTLTVTRKNGVSRYGEVGKIEKEEIVVTRPDELVERLSELTVCRSLSDVVSNPEIENTPVRPDLTVRRRTMKLGLSRANCAESRATRLIYDTYRDWISKNMPEALAQMSDFLPQTASARGMDPDDAGKLPFEEQMAEMIGRLVRAADDPARLLRAEDDTSKGWLVAERLAELKLVAPDYVPQKARAVAKYLASPEGSGKYLVFCQFVDTTQTLKDYFDSQGIKSFAVVGGTSQPQRAKIRTAFERDPEARALICTDVLGTGMNFGFADGVIHYSRPWNDSLKQQRETRITRLDSKGEKTLLTVGSDLYIDNRKEFLNVRKNALLDKVLAAARVNTERLAMEIREADVRRAAEREDRAERTAEKETETPCR